MHFCERASISRISSKCARKDVCCSICHKIMTGHRTREGDRLLTKPCKARRTSKQISEGEKATPIEIAAIQMHPRTNSTRFPQMSPSLPHNLGFSWVNKKSRLR